MRPDGAEGKLILARSEGWIMMKTIRLLIGNKDRRTAQLIESLVRDVCREHAVVTAQKTGCVDELLYWGCTEDFDLIIFTPDNLTAQPNYITSTLNRLRQAQRAARAIRTERATHMIATGVPPEYEMPLLEAGVDSVLPQPFSCEELKSAVRNALNFYVAPELQPVEQLSFGQVFQRGFRRLTEA